MTELKIPVLRSAHLALRAIRASDHASLLALAQDPDVSRFMHEGPPPSAADVWNRMAGALGQWALRGYGMMAVDDYSGFVGRIGFFHPYGAADPLLVYAFASRSWGRGYATESSRLILAWLAETHGPLHVAGLIDPNNTGSIRVAEKLGAIRQGTAERNGAVLDVWNFTPDVPRADRNSN